PIARPTISVPVTEASYAADESRDLEGPLLGAALGLMLLDTLAVLWMGGFLGRFRRRPATAATAIAIMAAGLSLALLTPHAALAQDSKPGDQQVIAAIGVTRIAYVITGDPSVDAVSRAGIEGLSRFLTEKTALEPGEPAGVHITEDELAFYPLIYWPVETSTPLPTEEAMARIDAYMRQGGTVLFDTRDQYASGFSTNGAASPNTMRLREI